MIMRLNKSITLFLLCTTFSSCQFASQTADPSIKEYKDITINFYTGFNDEIIPIINEILDEYKTTINYDITLKCQKIGEGGPLLDGNDLALVGSKRATIGGELGYYSPLYDSFKKEVKNRDNKEIVNRFTSNSNLYGFPLDFYLNTYLFYDSSSVSNDDLSSWDKLIDKANSLNKKIAIITQFDMQFSGLFYKNNVDTTFDFTKDNGQGKIATVKDNYNTNDGLLVSKALASVINNSSVDYGLLDSNNDYAAILNPYGNVFIDEMEDYFGDNLAISNIPSITYEEKTYEWPHEIISEGLVIKESEDIVKKYEIMQFASYLSNEINQLKLSSFFNNHLKRSMTNSKLVNNLFTSSDIKDAYDVSLIISKQYRASGNLFASLLNNDYTDDEINQLLNEYHNKVLEAVGDTVGF